jgi:hypothetical protein
MLHLESGDGFCMLFLFFSFTTLCFNCPNLSRDSEWLWEKHFFDLCTLILIKASVSWVMAHCSESSWDGEGQ